MGVIPVTVPLPDPAIAAMYVELFMFSTRGGAPGTLSSSLRGMQRTSSLTILTLDSPSAVTRGYMNPLSLRYLYHLLPLETGRAPTLVSKVGALWICELRLSCVSRTPSLATT